jgi:hypothetical protein
MLEQLGDRQPHICSWFCSSRVTEKKQRRTAVFLMRFVGLDQGFGEHRRRRGVEHREQVHQ